MKIGDFLESVSDGDIEAVEEAIELGLDLDTKDSMNRTALMEAANFGHIDIVQLLLENGANPNLIYSNGQTALSDVAYNWGDNEKGLKIIKLLCENGADVNIKFSDGKTIMDRVKNKKKLFKLLKKYS
jgi:uncharacterized protein